MNYDYLQLLKKLGVKFAEATIDGKIVRVEFFPSTIDETTGEAVEFKKREEERSALTGLTQSESRDLLNMDE